MKLFNRVCRLYCNYKKTDDEKIVEYIDTKKIATRDASGRIFLLGDEHLAKIKENPRGVSLTFNCVGSVPAHGRTVATLSFLVKSSSRFFLKPDIGEIIDAIRVDHYELRGEANNYDMIVLDTGHTLLPETQGEHFLMNYSLVISDDGKK